MSTSTHVNHTSFGYAQQLAGNYADYNERVIEAGGTISNPASTQAALNLLPQLPNVVQWLDTRAGGGYNWYSLTGPATDATQTNYGSPMFSQDDTRGGQRTLAGGGWNGGVTPELDLSDDYTIGMQYYQPGPEPTYGLLWGNRYGNTRYPGSNVWNQMGAGFWQNYFDQNHSFSFTLPIGVWAWVWLVKQGATVTLYDQTHQVLGSLTLDWYIGELPLGIGGGTDSSGISPNRLLRFMSFFRAAAALTPAQREAVMAV